MSYPSVLCRTLVFLAVALIGLTAYAQGTASVSGTVRDAQGMALPGVSVVLENLTQAGQQVAVTDGQGRYSFAALAVGSYRLTASLSGFDPGTAELQLAAGQSATRDFSLNLASFYESITVTAQKREQEILDVPMSITAVTGTNIQDQGVTQLAEIVATIPSLSIVETGPGTQRAQIRGISSPQNLPTVGVYFDEMPITSQSAGSGLDVRLLDLERVEVLRGPQGTLYGESSMGGTIKYVTRDPQLDGLGIDFDSAYGTVTDGDAAYRANAVVNIPAIEGKLGFRVLGGYEHSPGWVDYPAQGRVDGNEGDATTLRIKGLWIVNDAFTASLMLQGQDSDYDDQNYADPDRTAPFVLPQPLQEESKTANLVLTWETDSFTLLSSTGYLDRENEGAYDFTALYLPIFELFGFPPGTVDTVALTFGGNSDHWSEEIRLASKGDGRLNWTAGAYYRHNDSDGYNLSVTTPNPLPFEVFQTTQADTTQQSAVFGEITYGFTKKLDATLGLRYFHDKRERQSSVGQFGPPADNPDQSGTFDSTDPRLVLSYRPSDGTLLYASAAKGFRSGGFNLVPPGCSLPTNFDPESLWTYEIGSSASMKSGRVVVQGALYHNDWTDIQTLTLCPGTFVALTDNVGKASGNGVDLQLTLTPARGLQFTVSGNYNDSQYDMTSISHNDGDQIDYATPYNYAAAVDWSFLWWEGHPGLLHLTYQTTGPFDINLRNFGIDPLSSDAITGLSARLAMTLGGVELSLYGQNLLDEDGAVSPAIPLGGVPSAVRLQPMTLGVGLGFRY